MPIIISVSPKEATRAGRVARVIEIRGIQLVNATFRVWADRLNGISKARGRGAAPIELDVAHKKSATLQNQGIRTLITIRLVGVVRVGKRPVKVIESRCVFESKYSVPSEIQIPAADLNAFASTNALLNIWPYWREHVQSMASKAGLPTIIVPLLLIRPAKMTGGTAGGKRVSTKTD